MQHLTRTGPLFRRGRGIDAQIPEILEFLMENPVRLGIHRRTYHIILA